MPCAVNTFASLNVTGTRHGELKSERYTADILTRFGARRPSVRRPMLDRSIRSRMIRRGFKPSLNHAVNRITWAYSPRIAMSISLSHSYDTFPGTSLQRNV